MAEYCNQSSMRNLATGRYSTAPRQMSRSMWGTSHNQAAEGDETYEKINLPALNKGVEDYEAYTPMNVAPPVLPPQRNEDNIQSLNILPSSDGPDKKAAVTLIRVKKTVLVIGIFLLICFLLSLAALSLGVLNLTDVLTPATSTQIGAQSSQGNVTQAGNKTIEDIMDQVRILEQSLIPLQERLASVQENATSGANAIREQASIALAAESARINLRLTSLSTQVDTTEAFANNVSSRINARVNLYQGCYKDSVSCVVGPHSTNVYWYLCNTPFLLLNVTGYFTLSTQCHRDPETKYIDTAYVEVSNRHVRCVCYVVGLTSSGNHGSFALASNPPSGDCHLVITRCPTSQNIFP